MRHAREQRRSTRQALVRYVNPLGTELGTTLKTHLFDDYIPHFLSFLSSCSLLLPYPALLFPLSSCPSHSPRLYRLSYPSIKPIDPRANVIRRKKYGVPQSLLRTRTQQREEGRQPRDTSTYRPPLSTCFNRQYKKKALLANTGHVGTDRMIVLSYLSQLQINNFLLRYTRQKS